MKKIANAKNVEGSGCDNLGTQLDLVTCSVFAKYGEIPIFPRNKFRRMARSFMSENLKRNYIRCNQGYQNSMPRSLFIG